MDGPGKTDSSRNNLVCDSTELQACLEANKGDRSKCLKEWDAFREKCSQQAVSRAKAHHATTGGSSSSSTSRQ
ncbi:hypothetical protein BC831DRAFT_472356 [Entophlyctis helioformis]|nr:hypothetical protein BC831DRAFT_472356 [Entophlyctis helioformis]